LSFFGGMGRKGKEGKGKEKQRGQIKLRRQKMQKRAKVKIKSVHMPSKNLQRIVRGGKYLLVGETGKDGF
jgi:hypothetical protein